MARPLPGEPDVPLANERLAYQLISEIGQIQENGRPIYSGAGTGSLYQYIVWITNDGSSGCRFQLDDDLVRLYGSQVAGKRAQVEICPDCQQRRSAGFMRERICGTSSGKLVTKAGQGAS
jgi:hypothetical protein